MISFWTCWNKRQRCTQLSSKCYCIPAKHCYEREWNSFRSIWIASMDVQFEIQHPNKKITTTKTIWNWMLLIFSAFVCLFVWLFVCLLIFFFDCVLYICCCFFFAHCAMLTFIEISNIPTKILLQFCLQMPSLAQPVPNLQYFTSISPSLCLLFVLHLLCAFVSWKGKKVCKTIHRFEKYLHLDYRFWRGKCARKCHSFISISPAVLCVSLSLPLLPRSFGFLFHRIIPRVMHMNSVSNDIYVFLHFGGN